MVEKSQDKEMDKSVAVGNVENNSEKVNNGGGIKRAECTSVRQSYEYLANFTSFQGKKEF